MKFVKIYEKDMPPDPETFGGGGCVQKFKFFEDIEDLVKDKTRDNEIICELKESVKITELVKQMKEKKEHNEKEKLFEKLKKELEKLKKELGK